MRVCAAAVNGVHPNERNKTSPTHNAIKPGDPTPGIKKSPDIITGALLVYI